ncbi:MAG TPA: biopolymer transporter ExbB [Cycloclasticus sp.]|nr:biopolymer transporter ExbB [Cycloclasticus sp.]
MRILSVFNLTLLMLLVSVVILISPSHLFALINIPGLLVVLGGTLCAVLLSKPQHKVLQLIRELPDIIKGQPAEFNGLAEFKQLLRCAHLYRSGQVRLLEQEIKLAQQPILLKGVQLILDRCSLDDVTNILRKERARLLLSNQEKSQILRLMSSYAPAFGMLGTLLGMIHMLYGLGEVGLEQVGVTMGFALLTTLYGLVVANLACKPLAIKLENRTAEHAAHLNTLMEGLAMMHEKTHPMVIRDMLEAHGIPEAIAPAPRKKVKSRFSKFLPLAASHVD